MTPDNPREHDFATMGEIAHYHSEQRPDHRALVGGDRALTCRELTQFMEQFGAALQRDGFSKGNTVAICCEGTSALYGAIFLSVIGISGVAVQLVLSDQMHRSVRRA